MNQSRQVQHAKLLDENLYFTSMYYIACYCIVLNMASVVSYLYGTWNITVSAEYSITSLGHNIEHLLAYQVEVAGEIFHE